MEGMSNVKGDQFMLTIMCDQQLSAQTLGKICTALPDFVVTMDDRGGLDFTQAVKKDD